MVEVTGSTAGPLTEVANFMVNGVRVVRHQAGKWRTSFSRVCMREKEAEREMTSDCSRGEGLRLVATIQSEPGCTRHEDCRLEDDTEGWVFNPIRSLFFRRST